MNAMALTAVGAGRLEPCNLDVPVPGPRQVLVRVLACGVCRTDLHVIDGELPNVPVPIVPGHEIVGHVETVGSEVMLHAPGDRVGIPWLGWTCGACEFCATGRENLCAEARYTGYQLHGGYAEYVVAEAEYCFKLPERYSNQQAAPLLCAGLIGYRAYRKAGAGARLGIYGFGAAAHILSQVARQQGRDVYAFVTPGDDRARQFALDLGARWAGYSNQPPPAPLDSAIIFAPVGSLVPEALAAIMPGGIVVCAGIHMSDIPSFSYRLLWRERTVTSVANLTRQDGREFLDVAATLPLELHTHPYLLTEANRALDDLRAGRLSGAAVIVP